MNLGIIRANKQEFVNAVKLDEFTNDNKRIRFSNRFVARFQRSEWERMARNTGEDDARAQVAEWMYESVARLHGIFELRRAISKIVNERELDDEGHWLYTTPDDEVRAKVNEVLDEFFSEMYPNCDDITKPIRKD